MTDEINAYLWGRRYKIHERALMNRMYYQERQRIFEWREGFVKATSILAGSVAFANVADPTIIKWCAAFITGASTASFRPCRQRERRRAEKPLRPVTVNLPIAISPITCAFTLRRCVRRSFAFLAMRHVIQWAKIFCLTQRRNDATLRAKNLNGSP